MPFALYTTTTLFLHVACLFLSVDTTSVSPINIHKTRSHPLHSKKRRRFPVAVIDLFDCKWITLLYQGSPGLHTSGRPGPVQLPLVLCTCTSHLHHRPHGRATRRHSPSLSSLSPEGGKVAMPRLQHYMRRPAEHRERKYQCVACVPGQLLRAAMCRAFWPRRPRCHHEYVSYLCRRCRPGKQRRAGCIEVV